MMTAPLILHDPRARHPEEQDVVMILNDFTTRDPAAILAALQGQMGPGATSTRMAGYWMIHCHVLYHQAAGMMTVLHYAGFENRSYDPLASLAEFPR